MPDDALEREGEEVETGRGNVAPLIIPEWVPKAWEMRIVGMQSWESIAAAVGHHWQTVQKWVVRYSQVLGEVLDHEDTVHARAEYVASLQRIKRQAEQIVLESENPFAKTGALNTRLRACEKLAAAKGVVTERKQEERATPPDDPLLKVLERFAPKEIAEEIGNGRFPGDAGGGAGRDPAAGGGEAVPGEGQP